MEPILNILSLLWIGLIIYEFIYGLSNIQETIFYLLWAIFVIDFIVEITLAPNKIKYLRNNILVALSLLVPALRVFRIIRLAGLARMVGSMGRGFRTVRSIVGSRGVVYVSAITLLVMIVGSVGIFYFENPSYTEGKNLLVPGEPHIRNYGDALWFTSMLIVTLGSEYWPKTTEGRILTFMISLYSFAVFGFITATIASYLIGERNKKPRPFDRGI